MGNDQSGQLGDGIVNSIYNPAETNLPEMIVASNVTAIAAGFNHSLFLKSDGSLWGMGANNYGQLGDGTYNSTNRPELIVAGGVTAIAAGSFHSLFLKSDGSLWAMGSDVFGQLGDGIYNGINNDTNSTNEPELIVPGPPGYDQISIQPLTGGTVLLSFLGMAGANYALDYTPNLAPPVLDAGGHQPGWRRWAADAHQHAGSDYEHVLAHPLRAIMAADSWCNRVFSFAPSRGLLPFCLFPTADAVGYYLAPRRGLLPFCLFPTIILRLSEA